MVLFRLGECSPPLKSLQLLTQLRGTDLNFSEICLRVGRGGLHIRKRGTTGGIARLDPFMEVAMGWSEGCEWVQELYRLSLVWGYSQ